MRRQDPLYLDVMKAGAFLFVLFFFISLLIAAIRNDWSILSAIFGASDVMILNIIGIIIMAILAIGFVLYLIELIRELNEMRLIKKRKKRRVPVQI